MAARSGGSAAGPTDRRALSQDLPRVGRRLDRYPRAPLSSGRPKHEAVRGGLSMAGQSVEEMLAELRSVDSPTITNVVATYPKNPLCLGLYNPWTENWYTDTSIRCIYPEMGAVVGYAVTCVYGLPDPNYAGRLSFMDVVDALDASPKPTILILQQKWPPELFNKAGLA